MILKNIKSALFAASVLMLASCAKDPVADYVEPPKLEQGPDIQWAGTFAGPQGIRPRFSQASDTTLLYAVTKNDLGIHVAKSTQYGSKWDFEMDVLAISSITTNPKEPHMLAQNEGQSLIVYNKNDKSFGLLKGTMYGEEWEIKSDIVVAVDELPISSPFLLNTDNGIYCYYSQKAGTDIPLTHLMLIKSIDDGESWSEPVKVMNEEVLEADGFINSPSFVMDRNNEFVAVFEGKDLVFGTARSVLCSKSIDGITWSKPTTAYSYPGVNPDVYGAGDSFVTKTKDGRLIATFQAGDGGGDFGYVISNNNGKSWSTATNLFKGKVANGTTAYVTDNAYLFVAISGTSIDLAPMDPNAIIKSPFYLFVKGNDDYCVDANFPWPTGSGNPVHFWGHDNMQGAVQKTWSLYNNKDGYFWFQSVSGINGNGGTGTAVESINEGEVVKQQQIDLSKGEQLWTVVEVEDGYYRIVCRANGLVLTAVGKDGGEPFANADGDNPNTELRPMPYVGSDAQLWQARSLNPDYKPFEHFLKENEDNDW
ncbi:MAG: RICIN domain-containing protein [Bacteroidota bacterium]